MEVISNPQERLDKIREQTRLRAAKHYAKNKEKLNETKRIEYLKKNPKPNVDIPVEIPVEIPVVEEVVVKGKKTKAKATKNETLNQQLMALELNPNTRKKYLLDFTRLVAAINNEDIVKNLKRGGELVEKIKATEYANNTKLGMIQICLFMITKFNIVVNKKSIQLLTQYYNERRLEASNTVATKCNTEEVPTWTEYISKVKKEYGENSKMYLIASLYRELTLRDDFTLKILKKKPKTTDENYLILNKNNYTIIINQYKTKHLYGVINVKLSKGLTGLITRYMEANNLNENDYLLGDKELSSYILYHNHKIGVDGGVSLFRHMTVSEEMSNPKLTDDMKVKLAEKMKHSVFMQRDYSRKLKKMDAEIPVVPAAV